MKLELIIGEAVAGFVIGFYNGMVRDKKLNFELELANELKDKNSILRGVFQDAPEFKELCSEENIYVLNRLYSTSQISVPVVLGLIGGTVNCFAKQGYFAFPAGLLALALPTYIGSVLGEKINKAKRKRAKLDETEIKSLEIYIENYKQNLIKDKKIEKAETMLLSYLEKLILKKRNVELIKPILQKVDNAISYAEKYKRAENN